MVEHALLVIGVFCLLYSPAVAATVHTHYAIVISSYLPHDKILVLPNSNGTTSYWKTETADLSSQRFAVTKAGTVYSLYPLHDVGDKKVSFDVGSLDSLRGEYSRHHVVIELLQPSCFVENKELHRYRRRTLDISISATVKETVREVSLDYAGQGILDDAGNRYYLLEDDTPFSHADMANGKLMVSQSTPLDYETAPSHQYSVTILVNNTDNSDEYIVAATIILLDVNDEVPVFTMQPSPYLAAVDPNLPVNSKVDYLITVSDSDADSFLIFSLLEGSSKFRINQKGELYTIDRLSPRITYTVKVKVIDSNAELNTQSAEATIQILAGQRPPQFYEEFYRVTTPENVQGAELDVTIKAKSFQGDAISFSMSESQIFMIVEVPNIPNEARIRITTSQDYETDRRSHMLTITAIERGTGLSSRAEINIILADLNDNSPIFDLTQYVAGEAFSEDVPDGTQVLTVRALDADPVESGNANGQITYSLQSDMGPALPFRVKTVKTSSGYDGVIEVSGKLDYDRTDATGYVFRVIAADGGVPQMSSSAYVRVQVQNTNDEAPRFAGSAYQRIESTKPVDSVVTTVFASDPDGDKVTYALAEREPPSAPFRIDPLSGSIFLTESLDNSMLDGVSSFALKVSATDDGSCCEQGSSSTNVGYLTVTIEIVGRNNAPEFTTCTSYSDIAKAPENTLGAFVVQVSAEDADVGPNGNLTYSLVGNDDARLFTIEGSTGDIYTNERLDRENTNQLTITVKAEDQGLSKLSSFCTFTMTVQDLNDNSPSLSLPSSQVVQVDLAAGSLIYSVFATDPDFDINGTNGLTYALTGNGNFEMDGNNLRNKVKLGIALAESQPMTIVVRDHGNRTARADFTVNIRQTAEAPVFTDVPPEGFKIPENLTDDHIIYRIKATSATGGPVNYFLVPSTTLNSFYMRSDDQQCNDNNMLCLAVYQSKNLDADKLRFYKLRVRVTPKDSSSVVTEQTIDIELTDVNDNIPVFENQDINGYITGSVIENTTVKDAQVCVVKANDSDITPAFKTDTYSLEPGGDADLFRIGSKSGIVQVDQDVLFDREDKSQYIIYVKATDGAPSSRQQFAGRPNSVMATVQVIVNDVNDNPPYFPQQQYTDSVEETAPKGKLVMNIRANDLDIENNFQYVFVSGNEDQAFEITTTGNVLVFSPSRLDYETKKEYEMVAQVSDGRYQARTNVRITLIDMNDNVPVFSQRIYTVNNVVEEDKSISTSNRLQIATVSATDGDRDRPNNIEYSLSGSYSDRFQIDSDTGDVYLVRALDRDDQPQWDVNVLASDEPGSPTNRIGYAIISVFPLDINDNPPKFNENTLSASLKENTSEIGQILAIQASDKDAGNNGTVKFRLVASSVKPSNYPAQGYPYFAIDDNGVVTADATFDRERVDRYTLEVVAYDAGSPIQLSSTATVILTIEDINDNPPKFEPDFYETRVSELASPLSFILQVNVVDLDSTAVFSYQLNDDALKNFSISEGNIYIRDQQRLDYEHFSEKNQSAQMIITVTVSDGYYEDVAKVTIILVDENDETPVFKRPSVTVTLSEDVPIGTLVHTFTATDKDAISTPRNSEIEYLIDRTSDFNRYFKVSNKTGEVRTQRMLDRETIDTHVVRVLAVDKGYPVRRTGTATLIVQLDDINDNGPRLVTPTVRIEENYPASSYTSPREIRAIDDDDNTVGHGPPFKMAPANGSENSRDFRFIFHPDWDVPDQLSVPNGAGELLTRRVLDREGADGPQIDFYLNLTDSKGVSAVRQLSVIVADEDDNPPSPGRRESLIYNYKGQYKIVKIGDCYAEDKDDWDKPYKSYEKVGSWPDGFSINADSGMISADLTKVPSGTYDFQCKVIDNYIPDPNCALSCNSGSATDMQKRVCKDACRQMAEAISDVSATIKTLDEAPVWNGASIRLKGTADEFMRGRAGGSSPYEIFTERLANSLNTEQQYVDVFSVLDSNSQSGFIDVRFTAHGSPYYNTTRLIGAVLDDNGLEDAIGMPVAQVPINDCLMEVCAGGCTNRLSISDDPTLVNANGSSLVGVTSRVERVCACSKDDGSAPQKCTPDSCLHGGQCIYNRDSETTSCECLFPYDGPRCQQLRHSFNGAGWAQYKTLSQCANSSTTIEFITKQPDAMMLYNGPLSNPGTDTNAVPDYLLIAITDSKPVVYVNLGTGHVKLSVDGIVSNGVWHKLELNIVDRLVTLTLDDCQGAQVPDWNTSQIGRTRASCQDSQYAPGENQFLNVASLLEMGGRAEAGAWWPTEVPAKARQAYDGCLRSFHHNGELYDLYVGNIGRQSNSEDGCRREDDICIDSNGVSVCGENSICEATLDGAHSCTCKPGWRGESCSTATGYMDLRKSSFVEWKLLRPCSGASQCMAEAYRTHIQFSFRSRDLDNSGLLFYARGNRSHDYIKVMIVGGQLQLMYDIGSDSLDVLTRGQMVTLPVTVTDGDLHTVTVTRVGKRFTLSMDGGEGRYSVQHEDVYSHQLFIAEGSFYSGGDGPYISGGTNVTASSDLENTCITDVRYNGMWFPSTSSENADTDSIELVRKQNVGETCSSDGCRNVNCPGLQQCRDLWRDYECSCSEGYETLYAAPYCLDIDECFPDSPCVHGTCRNSPGSFECDCTIDPATNKLYIGRFCNQAPSKSVLELETSAIVVFFLSLLVIILLALAIFCYVTRRSNRGKDETLLDSYNDVRETIYNYDEEGMPEEDQDGYDISRLGRPFNPDIQPTLVEPLGSSVRPPSNHPPDVADFITGRLNDADDDPTNCPGDEVKEYDYEGNSSDAGTLSSLNSTSSEGDQEFDHLQDWGPKFARLADMYKGEE